MTTSFTIGIVGQMSSGKSSFINALCGEYVASCSLQRETFEPTKYVFVNDKKPRDYTNVITEKKRNKLCRDSTTVKSPVAVPMPLFVKQSIEVNDRYGVLPAFNPQITVIDFPGLNDSHGLKIGEIRVEDGKTANSRYSVKPMDKYLEFIRRHMDELDLVLFITSASSAFTLQSELECFEKVSNMCQEKCRRGRYVNMLVVNNKFDHIYDEDYNEIHTKMTNAITSISATSTFRFSSHNYLVSSWIRSRDVLTIPLPLISEFARILKSVTVINVSESPVIVHMDKYEQRDGDYDNLFQNIVVAITTNKRLRSGLAFETIKVVHEPKMTVMGDYQGTREYDALTDKAYHIHGVINPKKALVSSNSPASGRTPFNTYMNLAKEYNLNEVYKSELLKLCTSPYYYEKFGLVESYVWDQRPETVSDAIYMYSTYDESTVSEFASRTPTQPTLARPTDLTMLNLLHISIQQELKTFVCFHGPDYLRAMFADELIKRRDALVHKNALTRYLCKLSRIHYEKIQTAIIRNEIRFDVMPFAYIINNIKFIAAGLAENTIVNILDPEECVGKTDELVKYDS